MSEYQDAVKIVDTYIQSMTDGDYTAAANLYADDARLEDPVGSKVLVGRATILEFYRGNIADGNLTCTRTGPVRYANRELAFPFECLAKADEGRIKIEIIDHFVLNDEGLIVSMRAFWGADTIAPFE